MFRNAYKFDQDLSNWDVSSSTNFVSNNQDIQFESVRSLLWLLKEQALSTNLAFHYFLVSKICLGRPLSLTRTSVTGMSPVVPAL
jgi:hypothetical protein